MTMSEQHMRAKREKMNNKNNNNQLNFDSIYSIVDPKAFGLFV